MFNCPKVRVYNSPANLFFVARYMACAMASSPYCYFQDDDWMIHHLRAFYANFLRFPHLLHTDTRSDVWSMTNWQWCFFEDGKCNSRIMTGIHKVKGHGSEDEDLLLTLLRYLLPLV